MYNATPRASAIQLAVVKTGQPDNGQTNDRRTILVTKSNQIYEVAKYHRDGDLLMFVDTEGRKGGVDINEVDWRKTTGMTMEARSGDAAVIARQTN